MLSSKALANERPVRLLTLFWSLASVLLVIFFLFFLWLAVPSGYMVRIADIVYDPASGNLRVERTVMGDNNVSANVLLSVEAPNGEECTVRRPILMEPKYRDGTPKTSVVVHLGEDMTRCLDQPGNVLVARFTVLWWGIFPLRPTDFIRMPDGDSSG